ncbi:MAG: hypothetical protein J6T47_03045, partial [Lachnospiraceae bacterium]|nr:hypothetical protein [Lachnospiraceae bacterium]
AVLVYRCVDTEDPDSSPETSDIQGALHMRGHCDIENMLRLTFSADRQLKMTKYDTVSKISGYFDFAENRIASDVNSEILFTSEKPDDYPDLSEFYQTIVQSGQ